MFRILIVEDIQGTLQEWVDTITEAFTEPNGEVSVSIHTAESVSDAKQKIEDAHYKKRPYHAVILDANLPPEPNRPPKVDDSLCKLVRDVMKSTLVVHITIYDDDSVVKEHLRTFHQEQVDPRSFALSKSASDSRKLVEKLRGFLYSMRVEEQMNSIFGQQTQLSFAARGRNRIDPQASRFERDSTLDIAALRRDIVAHWSDLDARLKERIQLVFRVDDKSVPVRISLVREPEPEYQKGV
jgi:hypothetical protein